MNRLDKLVGFLEPSANWGRWKLSDDEEVIELRPLSLDKDCLQVDVQGNLYINGGLVKVPYEVPRRPGHYKLQNLYDRVSRRLRSEKKKVDEKQAGEAFDRVFDELRKYTAALNPGETR